ncbi:hypothetical protein [Mycobacteroides abscessus]|uniref:hypothetical protein n=1 Tax=Mycobacteroides abscessus TaxID=36809 RepID=UPI000928952B|nr:hypothetical protein [Mycobacteroides abscessus]SIF98875.1 Uncharacterised protein [Mycobacteroides abscessus subsp. abscessus]SKW93743.1 Uncharacterised protein [Mycobacteroides abscessus subsp. abscessus]SKX63854.1 Uncharacterised protein [Mycobacteroides abscessus subsp. abscessus]SKZ16836.1 Uncharacterised protein [Mycobacteroides abscessus subsp. abscessus]SKZ30405.1 Uncharacterised protein [Mycobacteroides abscessus subsp. abscessus]
MSEAQKLIIQILEGIFATWIDRDGVKHVLVDGDYDGITGRPIVDVAAEIDKALGGLTQEWATEFDSWHRDLRGEKRDHVEHFDYKGDEHSARDHVRTSKGVRLVTHFVSAWAVAE